MTQAKDEAPGRLPADLAGGASPGSVLPFVATMPAALPAPDWRRERVLPTAPPLPLLDYSAEQPVFIMPVSRPRPVAPPVLSEVAYAYRPWSGERVRALQVADEIDQLYRQTVDDLSESGPLSEEAQELLHQAREALEKDPAGASGVDELLERVKILLARAERSIQGAQRYGPRLAAYGAAWLLGLLMLLVFDRELAAGIGRASGRGELASLADLAPFWMCMVWGGIGAVAGSLFGLYRHVVRRDFDSEHKLGYLVQPVLGIVAGALVYLVTAAVLFVLGEAHTFEAARITATNPLALISALVGWGQRHAYDLLDGGVRRMLRAPAADAPAEPE